MFEPEYLVEKLEHPGGWSFPAMNEDMVMGYLEEMQVFCERFAAHRDGCKLKAEPPYLPPAQDLDLGLDSVKVMYAAYISDERGGQEVVLADLASLLEGE